MLGLSRTPQIGPNLRKAPIGQFSSTVLGPGRLQPPQFIVLALNSLVTRLFEEQSITVQLLVRMLNRFVRLATHRIVWIILRSGVPPEVPTLTWQCSMNIGQFTLRRPYVAETFLWTLVSIMTVPLLTISVHPRPVRVFLVGRQHSLILLWSALRVTLLVAQSGKAICRLVPQAWTRQPSLLVVLRVA